MCFTEANFWQFWLKVCKMAQKRFFLSFLKKKINIFFWDMGQNAIDQSDCRICLSIKPQEGREGWNWFLHAHKHRIFIQVNSIIFSVGDQACQIPKITSLQYFRIILRKKWGKNLFFWTTISFKVFYKLIPAIISHGQSIRNNKFPISLQCFKKEGRDEVDFSHANKH